MVKQYIKKNCLLIFLVVFTLLFMFLFRYDILECFGNNGVSHVEAMRKNLRFGRVMTHRGKVQDGTEVYNPGPDYSKMTGNVSSEMGSETNKFYNPQ